MLAHGFEDGGGDLIFKPLQRIGLRIKCFDREGSAGTIKDLRIVEQN